MSLKNRRRFAAVLIGVAVMSSTASAQAGEASDKTKTLIEKAKDAVLGREIHKLSLFSTMQNYQARHPRAMPSLLITVDISGNDGLAYFCHNQPRFREAVLRVISSYFRTLHGGGDFRADEVGRRTHALFARYLRKDWLVKVDARFLKDVNEAGPAVLKTREKCEAATS